MIKRKVGSYRSKWTFSFGRGSRWSQVAETREDRLTEVLRLHNTIHHRN